MRLAERLPRRVPGPVPVLAVLVLAQWAATVVFALYAERNGWLFFQGGDQTWLYTTAWVLSDGVLPQTIVGYGWSLLLVPIAWVFGPGYLAALPGVILLQVLVLQPVALVCVYALASRLAGRVAGYGAAAAWIAMPFAVIPLFDTRYHEKYVDQFVPQALGLTGLADYPSLVVLLVAAFFAMRALDTGAATDAVAAGLAAGFAVGIKPSNGLFVAAPLLGLAAARRWREAGAFSVALLPALVTLAVWKYRGLGHLPALAYPETRLAAGAVAVVGPLEPYLSIEWSRLRENEIQLREFFWSVRLLEWAPLAGAIGIARRSPPAAVFLGSWLMLFLVGKAASDRAGVEVGTFFRLLMPAFPAFFLLCVGLLLLVPVAGGLLASRPPAGGAASRRAVAVAAVAAAIVPFVVVVAARPAQDVRAVHDTRANTLVPVVGSLRLRAEQDEGVVRLSWDPPEGRARPFYRVLRAEDGEDVVCRDERPSVPRACEIFMELAGRAREPEATLDLPDDGRWTYRVGVGASWNDDPREGDILVLSEPVVVGGDAGG